MAVLSSLLTKKLVAQIRKLRILSDYQQYGVIIRRRKKNPEYICPLRFSEAWVDYKKEGELRNYSPQGMRSSTGRLISFINYLDYLGVKSFEEVSAKILSSYANETVHNHSKSIAAILTVQRRFLKFLYLKGHTTKDLSLDVPTIKIPYYPTIPSVWNSNYVKRMLEAIDKGNPYGKRNFAILLMITRLGIRIGDIKGLKLSDLKWDTKKIEFTQHKTGRIINFPILDDIGWAIIDYLKNGRPKTLSPYLFVRHIPPFAEFGNNANLHYVIKKYTTLAGLKVPHHAKQGMHSLRHTLASTLLENNTPLPVIAEIMGHMNSKSTGVYLKVGIEGLQKCALNPEEVFGYEE